MPIIPITVSGQLDVSGQINISGKVNVSGVLNVLMGDNPSGTADASETTAFLARTSGLDATHTNAYKALINGLVTDGVFSKFDALYIFATQDSTTALLNLVSTNYNLGIANTPTFTADQGYIAGVNGYLTTGFNPTTAGSPLFTQNSAHYSVWNNTNTTSAGSIMGQSGTGSNFYPKYTDNNAYFRVNDNPESGGNAISDPRGLLVGNRSASNAIQSYQNAVSLGTAATGSQAVANFEVSILYNGGTTNVDHELGAASFGSSLSGADVTNFYSRLRTYMTAVGVP